LVRSEAASASSSRRSIVWQNAQALSSGIDDFATRSTNPRSRRLSRI
jgi:hypothetical protein